MSLGYIMLHEISQAQKDRHPRISYMEAKKVDLAEVESRVAVTIGLQGWGEVG